MTARPRVFVASSYQDLRHAPSDLKPFIGEYGFDAVLFEDGGVAYASGRSPPAACLLEIGECDMLVGIIGGRFGSERALAGIVRSRLRLDEQPRAHAL